MVAGERGTAEFTTLLQEGDEKQLQAYFPEPAIRFWSADAYPIPCLAE